MPVPIRRDLLVVGAATLGFVLLGGVQANAADAPVAPRPLAASVVTATTTVPSTTTSSAPPSTTTTTPAAVPPAADLVDAAIRRWFPDVEAQAREIAWCESRHDAQALSSGGGNHGLFQINDVHAPTFPSVTGVSWEDGRYDAFHNARFARWLYDREGWEPWACA